MGLALAATACALKDRWVGAGVLIALAVLTRQFTLLVALPLLVVAAKNRRAPYVLSAAITAAIVMLPVVVLTHGQATRWVFLGSGASIGVGGTVVWELHIRSGVPSVVIARILPLVLSALCSWYVLRRTGRRALEPAILLALVALSLGLRLMLELNVFSYYYMALAVTLLLLDAVRGRLRETFFAWVAMVTLVYTEPSVIVWRQSWDQEARRWIPVLVMLIAVLFIVRAVLARRVGWNVVLWLVAVVVAMNSWPVSNDPLHHEPVTWLWQAVLVAIGLALAIGPLRTLIRAEPDEQGAPPEPEPASVAPISPGVPA